MVALTQDEKLLKCPVCGGHLDSTTIGQPVVIAGVIKREAYGFCQDCQRGIELNQYRDDGNWITYIYKLMVIMDDMLYTTKVIAVTDIPVSPVVTGQGEYVKPYLTKVGVAV